MNNSNLSDENFDTLVKTISDIDHVIAQLQELKVSLKDEINPVGDFEGDIGGYLANLNRGINNASYSITDVSRGILDDYLDFRAE